MLRLNDDDSRAVDVVLALRAAGNTSGDDDEPAAGDDHPAPPPDGLHTRLGCVQRLFKLLAMLPADDPSADLTARTLQTIEGNSRIQPTEPWPFALGPDSVEDIRPHV
jgi:hypothetical protein